MAAACNVDKRAVLTTTMGEVDNPGIVPPPYYWEPSRSQTTEAPQNPAAYSSAPFPTTNNDNGQQYYALHQNAATGYIPEANKRWHQSFCGCFDNFLICLVTFFCHPVTECCIVCYLDKIRLVIAAFIIATVASTILFLVFMYFEQRLLVLWVEITCFIILGRIILLIMLRIRIRRDYGIAGTDVEDICYVCFFTQCALCQMMVQIDHEYVVSGKRTFFSRV